MGIIDSHTHLTDDRLYPQADELIRRARLANIEHIVTIGDGEQDGRLALELAGRHACVSCSVGVHPHHAPQCDAAELEAVRRLARESRMAALGEIGLDYYYGRDYAEAQRSVLARQLEIAAEIDKPVVIHCREAFEDLFAALDRQPVPRNGIVHCFTGTLDEARECIRRGFKIGFTGVVTFSNASQLQEIAAALAPEDIVIETDAPYLAPSPKRGETNEPAFTGLVAHKMADLRNTPLVEMIETTRRNTCDVYRIKLPKRSPLLIRDGARAWLCVAFYHGSTPEQLRMLNEPDINELLAAVDSEKGLEEVWLGGYADPAHRSNLTQEVASSLKRCGITTGLITSGENETALTDWDSTLFDKLRFQIILNGEKQILSECPVAMQHVNLHWEMIESALRRAMEHFQDVAIQLLELPGAKIKLARHLSGRLKIPCVEMPYGQRF